MADSYTSNFNFPKPEVGGARNRWGTLHNDALDLIDTKLKDVDTVSLAAVKKAGDAMTGSLTFATNSQGLIFSGGTHEFDALDTQANVQRHYLDVAGDNFHIRTHDGNTELLTVDTTGLKYKGQPVLVKGDGSYLPITGGTLLGEVRGPSFRLDDQSYLTVSGFNVIVQFDNDSSLTFNRQSKTYAFFSGGASRASLDAGGNWTTSGDETAMSDERLKKMVFTIEDGLDLVKAIRPVRFTRIEDESRSLGVIAQELEKVIPELVRENDHGIKSVAYANLVAPLIAAVQELAGRVEALEGKR
ncbi:tail fiber domain-containing protein [Methylobacterium terricola]|uniref:Tail fiber domain-containing protein n=1 Tax=Methylobacterium terricola TaxID=2583531 RepID=A0A5C4LF61_9HYPH|nr:tail fiber domain-containing protein [Methylobacterium terricola]TNC10835.1 tail fiber domain-containing protein [Methylobacterium terricola]